VPLGQNLLLLLALAGIVFYFTHGYAERQRGTDFQDFYTAARMVREGQGHQLYNFHAQDQFQIRYAGRTGTYYIHPPFETLLFLPISLWSLPTAYLLWCVINVAGLAYTAILFQRHICNRLDWRVSLPLFFLFPPVLLSLLQGQDSLLLLVIMTLAVVALKRDQNFAAGCLLGCGLIKFHIILTLVVLAALLGRKGLLRGFGLVATTLLIISAAISGWSSLAAYPAFLMSLSSLPLAGIHPAAMSNVRGLVSVSGIAQSSGARLAVTWFVSALLLWYSWRSFRSRASKDAVPGSLALGNFVLAAILVSYHLSPPDLCIALLPLGLLLQYLTDHAGMPRWTRLTLLISGCILFLPPLHVISLARHVYWYPVIPILVLFLAMPFAGTGPVPPASASLPIPEDPVRRPST
jgi:Glycosyltransferase family 87